MFLFSEKIPSVACFIANGSAGSKGAYSSLITSLPFFFSLGLLAFKSHGDSPAEQPAPSTGGHSAPVLVGADLAVCLVPPIESLERRMCVYGNEEW